MGKEVQVTPEEVAKQHQALLDLESSWEELKTMGNEVMDIADKLEGIDKNTFENPNRQRSIRESEEKILGGILDLQAEAWVMIANFFASVGLEPPECEAKMVFEMYQARAKKRARIAPAGAVVVELDEKKLEQGIKRGWL